MDIDYLGLGMRWLHILAMATAVGATVFIRWALLPAIERLSPAERTGMHDSLRARWAPVVMSVIAILIISGLVSYFSIRQVFIEHGPAHKVPMMYNMLFGIKFLLALVVFFIASALVGRSPALAPIREQRRFWITLNLLLMVILICLSGVLRSMHSHPNPTPTVPVAELSSNELLCIAAPATRDLRA